MTIATATISGATTLSLPANGHSIQDLTIAASATVKIPAGNWIGQGLKINLCQNGTGGFTTTLIGDTSITLTGTQPTWTTTLNKCDSVYYTYDRTNTWMLTGYYQNW